MTCRSIPPALWAHAQEALVFYFLRRHGITYAEDLAQETLTALLGREDFEFEREEDFLRVCYAFAAHVSQSGSRKIRKHGNSSFDPVIHDRAAANGAASAGMHSSEMSVLLDEVIRIGSSQLRDDEWEAICAAAEGDASAGGNRFRVRLFRARQKLLKLTVWKKSSV